MAKKKRTEGPASERLGDTSRGGGFDEAYDATEPERIRDLERPPLTAPRDEDEFVTDAELEARELDLPSEED